MRHVQQDIIRPAKARLEGRSARWPDATVEAARHPGDPGFTPPPATLSPWCDLQAISLIDMAKNRFPVWRLIQSELEAEIRSGLIGRGDQLPSENDLAERFAIKPLAVQLHAYRRLEDAGLVLSAIALESAVPEHHAGLHKRSVLPDLVIQR